MARNITKTGEFDDLILYRATCKTCDLELMLEQDDDDWYGNITLTISGDFAFDREHFHGLRLHCRICRWIKSVFRLVFTGRIEVSTDFILGSQEQIGDFAEAIQGGLIRIRENKLMSGMIGGGG